MRQKKPATIRWEPPVQIKKEFTGYRYINYIGIDPGHDKMGVSWREEPIDDESAPRTISLSELKDWLRDMDYRHKDHGDLSANPLVLGVEWFNRARNFLQALSAAAEAVRVAKGFWQGPVIVCKVWPQYWHRKMFKGSSPGVGLGKHCKDWKQMSQDYCARSPMNLPGLSTDAAEAHLIRRCAKIEFEQRLLLKGAGK